MRVYQRGLRALALANVPFLVGGGYAFSRYTAIQRPKKDLDFYVRERDLGRAREALEPVSTRAELTFPHWLGRAYDGENFIDIIHNSSNGLAPVDDDWFAFAAEGTLLQQRVWLTWKGARAAESRSTTSPCRSCCARPSKRSASSSSLPTTTSQKRSETLLSQ